VPRSDDLTRDTDPTPEHEKIVGMPNLFPPAMPAGVLSRSAQPSISVAGVALLRPWILADAAATVEAFDDPAIRRWHVRRADSIDEARDLIGHWQSGWPNESEANWAMVDANTDVLLGRVALKGLDLHDATAEVAYWMCPAARGRGLCTQAIITLSEWAFRDGGFHRLELEHSIHNLASCRVAVKAGFREESIRRGAALHADGWHDMHVHARLSGDGALP
jgi:RimJ/RimL family protein N-acetyltransferase